MPYFSVIIPSHNRYDRLSAAVDSVLSQSFRDFELIVVDDGSTDDTPRLADDYAGRLRYLRRENGGVSAARNTGIRAARSPHVVLLDSDDLWFPEKLEAHRGFIENNSGIRLHQTDERWIRGGRPVNPMNKHEKPEGDIFIPSLRLCLVSPSCSCLEQSLFDNYGFFDEKLPACEDYDLWLRISRCEKVGLIREKLTIKHGGHEDQLSRRFRAMDRFRVYSICGLLSRHEGELPADYRDEAIRVAREKCVILLEGALKRGRGDFAEKLRSVIELLDQGSCRNTDFGNLLTE